MARPGLVLEVEDRTPPLVVPDGDSLRLLRFPTDTQVLVAPEPAEALADVAGAIAAALADPLDGAPLSSRLRAGMVLTVVVDDTSTPVPAVIGVDPRQRVVEQVLTLAAAAGVDDVVVLVATGLRRRLSPEELTGVLGDRVCSSFAPTGALVFHDASDTAALAEIDAGDGGTVAVNARAATSDLVVYVTVPQAPGPGLGAPTGLAGLLELVRPDRVSRVARAMTAQLPLFTVAATVGSRWFGPPYEFLDKREWEYRLADHARMAAARRLLQVAPRRVRQAVAGGTRARNGVTGIWAGSPGTVGQRAAAALDAQQLVGVPEATDVVVVGVPSRGPDNVGAPANPLVAAALGLRCVVGPHGTVDPGMVDPGGTGGLGGSAPVLREGGAVILFHPLRRDFSRLHHPSHVDFYDEVLAADADPATLSSVVEEKWAADSWYAHLWRTSYAVHGVHPFALWHSVAPAVARAADVVWVGADRDAAARLGFRAASTFADALEVVSGAVGRSPSMTYLHTPPQLRGEVR